MAWTDTNTHDPGITILEVLAYTLTAYGLVTLASGHRTPPGRRRALRSLLLGGVGVLVASHARASRDPIPEDE